MGRSQKAFKNVVTGLVNKLLIMFLAFATRTLFVRLLGAEYTGVNSLYTNILSVLSLAELGIGNVFTFYLYSALKDNDHIQICALVHEFKRVYMSIVAVILLIGLALIPFLGVIVKSSLSSFDITLYYVLYLLNSVASYFVVYRTLVLNADQKSYIQSICYAVSTIVMYVLQIAYLLIWRDFLGYIIIQLICTIGCNLVWDNITCKHYPFLKKYNSKIDSFSFDKKELFYNVKATFLYKISDKLLDQTDNIIISILLGTFMVGLYSNYYLLIAYLANIGGIIANGMVASLGNLVASDNNENSFIIFKMIMLTFNIFGTFCTVCYACVIQDFVPIWIGSQFLMEWDVVVAIIIVFYLRMATNTVWMYRSAMGLFKEVQYVNVAAAFLNIILSVVFGRLFGVAGIIVATAVARLLTSFWYEGKVVLIKLGHRPIEYFLQQLRDFITLIIIAVLAFLSCSMISIKGISAIVIKICICGAYTGIVILSVNWKTKTFRDLTNKVLQIFR